MMKENKKEYCILVRCPFCGRTFDVWVNEDDYWDFSFDGKLAQEAFPYLTPEDRELLISGICPDCWPTEEDDDDEENWFDDVDETGFNPYLGDYDYDC